MMILLSLGKLYCKWDRAKYDRDLLDMIMNVKIRGAEKKARKWKRLQGKERRLMEKRLGKNSRVWKKTLQELNRKSKEQADKVYRKNQKKIKHLREKYEERKMKRGREDYDRRTQEAKKLPEEIKEFSFLKIFWDEEGKVDKEDSRVKIVECPPISPDCADSGDTQHGRIKSSREGEKLEHTNTICPPICPPTPNLTTNDLGVGENKLPTLLPDDPVESPLVEPLILVIGDISMSKEELDILSLNPGYQVLDCMSDENIERELGSFSAKYRWERKRQMDEDLGDEEVVSLKDIEKGEIEEAKGKSIFDYGTNRLNLANRKVTDLKENRE